MNQNETKADVVGYDVVTKPRMEYVQPTEKDGVKFYVSADGTKIGLSQSGIARLAGNISESSIRSLLGQIAANQQTRKTALPSALIDYAEQDPYLPLSSQQQERVVRADIAAAIIEYYAFDSNSKNDMAVQAYRQFAKKGIEAWIKEIVGYQDINDLTISKEAQTNDVLMVLVDEVRQMKGQLAQTSGYRVAAQSMTGLVHLTNGYKPDAAKSKAYVSANDNQLYQINEWVELSGYRKLNNSELHTVALNVKCLYASMFLESPQKTSLKNEKGTSLSPVAAYPREHFPILETAYTQMLISKAQKKAAAEAKKLKRASEIVIRAAQQNTTEIQAA